MIKDKFFWKLIMTNNTKFQIYIIFGLLINNIVMYKLFTSHN